MAENVKVDTRPTQTAEPEADSYTPLVDIYEEADGTIVLLAELPGAKADDLEVQVDKGVLSISARSLVEQPEGYAMTYCGFAGGQFFRAFALSDEVDRDAISANLSDGVLTLRLPKAPAAKTRRIEIKTE